MSCDKKIFTGEGLEVLSTPQSLETVSDAKSTSIQSVESTNLDLAVPISDEEAAILRALGLC